MLDTTANELQLVATKTEPRIDSKQLADALGNGHRPTVALIDKYRTELESLGHVLFQKADGARRQGGGKAERVALLTEDQAFFLLTLSRNTERVVSLKVKLIQAFGRARRDAQQRKDEYLPEYHALHDRIKTLAAGSEHERHVHMNFNRLVNKVAGIEAGQRKAVPVAMLTAVQHVASLAMAGAADHTEGYARAKAALGTLQSLLKPSACRRIGHE
jgi:phage regulator Rha-like protein